MATIPAEQQLHPVGAYGDIFGETRFIGLELETTRNVNALPKVDNIEWNIEHSWYNNINDEEKAAFKKIIDPTEKFIAMLGADGGDIEITTEPISPTILLYDDNFNKALRNYNLYCLPDECSGTHVHISKLKSDKRNIWRNLYWFSVVYDKQLYAVFRRRSTWALSPKKRLQEMNKTKVSITDVRKLKYPTFGNKGTIIISRKNTYECRGGSASTDSKEIKAWAMMFRNIVELCNQTTIVGHRFEEVIPKGELGEILRLRLTGEQQRQICPIDLYL